MQQNSTLKGHLAALVSIAIWGTTFLSSKVLLASFSPVEILFFRYALAYAVLWLVHPKPLKLQDKKQEWLFAGAGLCGVTLYTLLEVNALTLSYASNVSVIVSAAPFFCGVFAALILKEEKLRVSFFAGFAVAITGIALISFSGATELRLNPLGDLLALGAAVTWGVYSILSRKITANGYNAFAVTRRIFFWSLVFMPPAMALFGFRLDLARFAEPKNLLNLLFLGLVASALCYVSWNTALGTLGTTRASVYIYLMPVVTVAASVLLLHERITAMSAVGMALTISGLFLSNLRPQKRGALREH